MDENLKLAFLTIGIRVLFAPFFAHIWDINTLQVSLHTFTSAGNIYEEIYRRTLWLQEVTGLKVFYEGYAYLPHVVLIYLPFYVLYLLLGGDPLPIKNVYDPAHLVKLWFSPDIYVFLLIIKLPSIITDALIALLLSKRSMICAYLYALSPYSILITAIWGMFDNMVALLLLLTVMLLEKGEYVKAGVAYSISLMKFYAIYAIVPILVFLWRRGGWRAFALFAPGLIIGQLPTLYFFLTNPEKFLTVLSFHAERIGGGITPVNALWTVLNLQYQIDASRIIGLIGLAVWTATSICVVKLKTPTYQAIIATMLAGLFLGKIVNEQYLLCIYPMLLIAESKLARNLEKWLIAFAMARSTPVYFAMPLLANSPVFWTILPGWYMLLTQEWYYFISYVVLFALGTVFFFRIIIGIFSLIYPGKAMWNPAKELKSSVDRSEAKTGVSRLSRRCKRRRRC